MVVDSGQSIDQRITLKSSERLIFPCFESYTYFRYYFVSYFDASYLKNIDSETDF